MYLEDNPGLLQEVGPHVGADDVEVLVEVDLDVLAEAGAVVVPRRLGVADGLHDGGGGKYLLEEKKSFKQFQQSLLVFLTFFST